MNSPPREPEKGFLHPPYQRPCFHMFLSRYPSIPPRGKAAPRHKVTTSQWLACFSLTAYHVQAGLAFFAAHSLHSLMLSHHQWLDMVTLGACSRVQEMPVSMFEYSRGRRHGRFFCGSQWPSLRLFKIISFLLNIISLFSAANSLHPLPPCQGWAHWNAAFIKMRVSTPLVMFNAYGTHCVGTIWICTVFLFSATSANIINAQPE